MSYIPETAMPHAKPHEADTSERTPAASQIETGLRNVVDTMKAHPRTGIAVGASLVLGAVVAAAIPALRAKPAPKKRATTAKTPAKRKAPVKRKTPARATKAA